MTRILNAEPDGYSDDATRLLESFAEVDARSVDRAGLLAALQGCDGLIVRLKFRVDEELLAAGPQLRVVATATTGLDHIDLGATRARGIEVISLHGERQFLDSIHATSEHAWALLLSLIRRIPWAMGDVLGGRWHRDDFRGGELYGKQLGIIGLGRVGRQVTSFGRAFGMKLAAYDVTPTDWPDDVLQCQTLQEVLITSDVVTLHAPLEGSTVHMIGADELTAMKPTAVLVNTARGELIDEQALVAALETRSIAGAALDVVQNERSAAPGRELVDYASRHDNLLLTPHIAGATWESMERCEVFIASRLAEFFKDGP